VSSRVGAVVASRSATTAAADLSAADLSVVDLAPPCPPGAGDFHGARCDPRVDTICSRPAPCYMARCLCDGYWEADLILPICDGGAVD
jgi:hypothetical protein